MTQRPALRTNRTMPVRTNKYATRCERCHAMVPEGQGALTEESGEWIVRHQGSCGAVEPSPEPAAVRSGAFAVPEGRYTVTFPDGSYKTLRVAQQDDDADFMPGRTMLAYLSGSDNDSSYTRFAHVDERGSLRIWSRHQANTALREAVKVLIGSPQAAAEAYAAHSGNCYVCGRTLTTPESLAAGIGPTCASRVAW